MTLKQLIDKTFNEIVDKYVEKIIIYEKKIKDDDELLKKIIELLYDFLEELMGLVFDYIYDKYQISVGRLIEEEIESLFYSRDGKTFRQRIKEYIRKRDDKNQFIYNIDRFFSTESIYSINKILFLKLKDHFRYCKVNNSNCCGACAHRGAAVEGWILCEDIQVSNLPPYHPSCKCAVIFSNDKEE